MRLDEVQYLARQLFQEYGLKDWQFKFDSAKRRFGQCRFSKRVISMSRHLCELNDEAQVKDTLLHEIAHALVGRGKGHGPEWKSMATSIGCSGTRCYSTEVVTPGPKYIGICPGGHTHERQRLPSRETSCKDCWPRFNRNFLIVWKRT